MAGLCGLDLRLGSAVGICNWDLWSRPVVGTCDWDPWLFCARGIVVSGFVLVAWLVLFAVLFDLLVLLALLVVRGLLAMFALKALPVWFAWLQCYTSISNSSKNNTGCAALQCSVCFCVEKMDSAQLIANWCKMSIF